MNDYWGDECRWFVALCIKAGLIYHLFGGGRCDLFVQLQSVKIAYIFCDNVVGFICYIYYISRYLVSFYRWKGLLQRLN